jgi:hypothetical protein
MTPCSSTLSEFMVRGRLGEVIKTQDLAKQLIK